MFFNYDVFVLFERKIFNITAINHILYVFLLNIIKKINHL